MPGSARTKSALIGAGSMGEVYRARDPRLGRDVAIKVLPVGLSADAEHGATAIDTMTAILKEDPPDLPAAERHIPPALARIVDRCLEKSPAARFQGASDLAFALDAMNARIGQPDPEPITVVVNWTAALKK